MILLQINKILIHGGNRVYMKEIKNLQEKRLIVARNIMLDQIEPTDDNIINAWCNTFSAHIQKE